MIGFIDMLNLSEGSQNRLNLKEDRTLLLLYDPSLHLGNSEQTSLFGQAGNHTHIFKKKQRLMHFRYFMFARVLSILEKMIETCANLRMFHCQS